MPHLVIHVPEPTPTLYLATPAVRDSSVANLEEALTEAARNCGLDVTRCPNFNGADPDIIFRAMVHDISAARIFAGLFAADSDIIAKNSDVMYQLGFAHSRSKTIILLIPHVLKPVFSDRCFLHCYAEQDIRSPSFLAGLQCLIRTAAADSGDIGIASIKSFPDTWVSLYDTWLNDPHYLSNYIESTRVAHRSTRLLQKITHAQIDPLLRKIDEIVAMHRSGPDPYSDSALRRCVSDFRATWRQYTINYYNDYLPFLKDLSRQVNKVHTQTLSAMAKTSPPGSASLLAQCQRIAEALSDAINMYVKEFAATTTWLEKVLDCIVSQPDTASLVSGKLTSLSRHGKGIMIASVMLQESLIKLASQSEVR